MSPRLETVRNQRAAADPRANAFVTANAGSGKTKVLVDRIARLLLTGAPPSAFLCITYTKAAAAEMQRRLLQRLGAWCVMDDAALDAALRDLSGVDDPATAAELARARALFAHALETPGGLRIQTIHAFCERLLARFPLEAGVAPGFEILDDRAADDLMMRARGVLLDEPAPAAAFQHMARTLDANTLQALFKSLMAARGALLDASNLAPDAIIGAMRRRHRALESSRALIERCLNAAPWLDYERAAIVLSESSANDQQLAARLRAALAARGGEAEIVFDLLCKATLKASGDNKGDPAAVTKGALKAHLWLSTVLGEGSFAARIADAALAVRAAQRAEDSARAIILGAAAARAFQGLKDKCGVLDFEDLITHAHALITRADAAPWILYKLDGGIDHILIDEGQDTSPAQWELLAPLQEEFFAGLGVRETVRTVFAVGDAKQSIYGFQGAAPTRFLSEAQRLDSLASDAGHTFRAPTLRASFRSTPEVLAAVDAAMRHVVLGVEPAGSDAVEHLADRAEHVGVVEWWPVAPKPTRPDPRAWDAPRDQERSDDAVAVLCAQVAAYVNDCIAAKHGVWARGDSGWTFRPMHAGDVLILVRKRGAIFKQMIKALKRAGLPVSGADRMTLREELAVEDCAALMRVALDPRDDLSLACVLKGPWVGLTDDDADLFPLAFGRQKGETLWSRLQKADDPKYAPARDFIDALIARGGAAPFEFLSWALESLDAAGRSGWMRMLTRLGAEARDPVEELLSRALTAGQRRVGALQLFLAELDNDDSQLKREMDDASHAVRVMTAHGAKGLEAPVVILPDTTAAADLKIGGGLMSTEAGFIFSKAKKDDDPVAEDHRARLEALNDEEYARLLYVAMTRARDRLIVCGAHHGGGKTGVEPGAWHETVGRAMETMGEAIETPFGPGWRYGAISIAKDGERASPPKAVQPPAWSKTLASPLRRFARLAPSRAGHAADAALSPRKDNQSRYQRGRLIHGLLQRLPEIDNAARRQAARAWLTRRGVDAASIDAFVDEAIGVFDDPRLAFAFGPGSRAEAPIIGEARGRKVTGVVDRLAVSAKAVQVIDFKTDRPSPEAIEDTPPAYILQMALYREALRRIFPGRQVSCALIWTETAFPLPLPDLALDAALDALQSS